jgi:hypothetical protein
MASTIQRNAEMANEYLSWQRHTRNRSRETLFIHTDVIQKLRTGSATSHPQPPASQHLSSS